LKEKNYLFYAQKPGALASQFPGDEAEGLTVESIKPARVRVLAGTSERLQAYANCLVGGRGEALGLRFVHAVFDERALEEKKRDANRRANRREW